MKLSVIVPVLNEAAGIGDFVRHLRIRLPEAEIVVVDGGSDDGTRAALQQLRDPFALHLVRTPRGRATQMNAGARLATGDTLLFLHADSRLPSDAARTIAETLKDRRVCGGCFRLRFPRQEWIYRISDSLGNLAVDLFHIAFGDHGIFCRREDFFRAGGYPLVPLMEDADFYRRLKRVGRVRQTRAAVVTSPRRYEQIGPYRTTFFYLLILVLYLVKVNPRILAQWHRRAMRAGAARPVPASSTKAPVPRLSDPGEGGSLDHHRWRTKPTRSRNASPASPVCLTRSSWSMRKVGKTPPPGCKPPARDESPFLSPTAHGR